MIPLPNDLWLRSPKIPSHAICFDPKGSHFLWVFCENPDGVNWTSVYALSAVDLVRILDLKDPLLDPFRVAVQKRLDAMHAHLQAERDRGAQALRETYGVRT